MSKSKTIWATVMGVLSSILAFLGLIGCCGLPILAGILAGLGIGASQLSFFAEYRWWFIGFAVLSLLFGFYQVYSKKKGNCCGTENNTSCCSTNSEEGTKPKSLLFQKLFLWIGTTAITIILIIGFKENNAVNSVNEGCCPAEEVIPNNESCCPGTQSLQPKLEQVPTSCCPQ